VKKQGEVTINLHKHKENFVEKSTKICF